MIFPRTQQKRNKKQQNDDQAGGSIKAAGQITNVLLVGEERVAGAIFGHHPLIQQFASLASY